MTSTVGASAPADLSPEVLRAREFVAAGRANDPDTAVCVCGATRPDHSTAACSEFRVDPAWELARRAAAADESDPLADIAAHSEIQRAGRLGNGWGVGPSDYGTCRRAIEYRERPPAGYEPLPEDTRKADLGTAFHTGLTAARRALYPWRMYGMQVYLRGLDRPGEIDEYDPVTGTVTDWKTAGDWTWDRVRTGPRPDHKGQVQIYAIALHRQGYEVRRCRILYVHRATGAAEYFEWDFDPADDEPVRWLMNVLTMLDLGIELPRDRSGPSTDPICRRCPARAHCWNIPEALVADRSPESYTLLGPDPDDPTIAWAARRLYEANEAYKAAEAAREQAKALLQGVRPGVVNDGQGPLEIYRGVSYGRPDYRGAYERALELMRLPEHLRPAELPPPRKAPNTYYTQVRPARAGKKPPRKNGRSTR
jgi:CRISPR/Cas system-associated exonuclease Cas4 (RecB family)